MNRKILLGLGLLALPAAAGGDARRGGACGALRVEWAFASDGVNVARARATVCLNDP